MGHLINPIAMRLGWTRSWENLYFFKSYYYAHMLHIIFKYRLYLIKILRSYFYITKMGILCSHFDFIQNGRFFYIYVYTYQSGLEDLIQEFVIQNFWFIRNLISNKQLYYDINFAQNSVLFFLIASLAFKHKNIKKPLIEIWPKKLMTYLINSFSDENFNSITRYLIFLKKIPIQYKSRFLVWFMLFKKFLQINKFDWWKGLLEFSYWYFSISGLTVFFKNQSIYFEHIAKYCFDLNVVIVWYRISNNEITPKFLSWYFAYKIKQHFTIKSLINPIRYELQRVSFNLNENHLNLPFKFSSHVNFIYKQKLKKEFYVYHKFFFNFWKEFYNIIKTWISYEHFLLLLQINFKWKFCSNNKKCKLILRLIRAKAWLHLYFLKNSNYFKFNKFEYSLNCPYIFISYAIIYFHIDIFNFKNLPIDMKYIYIGLSSWRLNKFLNVQFVESFFQIFNMLQLNKLKLREKQINRKFLFGLSGFKFHFVGRFSRKQRASSVYIQHGCLPLNNITANIDYSAYTIPVKNSSITVKVWFYYTNYNYNPYSIQFSSNKYKLI